MDEFDYQVIGEMVSGDPLGADQPVPRQETSGDANAGAADLGTEVDGVIPE